MTNELVQLARNVKSTAELRDWMLASHSIQCSISKTVSPRGQCRQEIKLTGRKLCDSFWWWCSFHKYLLNTYCVLGIK